MRLCSRIDADPPQSESVEAATPVRSAWPVVTPLLVATAFGGASLLQFNANNWINIEDPVEGPVMVATWLIALLAVIVSWMRASIRRLPGVWWRAATAGSALVSGIVIAFWAYLSVLMNFVNAVER